MKRHYGLKMNSRLKGKLAETAALFLLRLKGYRLLARNYVTGRGTTAGEVDLIVKRGNWVVFVEVKKRKTLDKAAYAILARQRERIARGAEAFLKKNPQLADCNIRFDAVLVEFPCKISHIRNAW